MSKELQKEAVGTGVPYRQSRVYDFSVWVNVRNHSRFYIKRTNEASRSIVESSLALEQS